MRHIALILFLVLHSLRVLSQSTVAAGDINGTWRGTKTGKELLLTINGSQAVITSIEGSKLPNEIVGGQMYTDIKYTGQGKWTARRNAWMYSSSHPEKGTWEDAGSLTLSLSADKNILAASGHWTFKREGVGSLEGPLVSEFDTSPLTKRPAVKATTKEIVTRDFGGVTGTLTRISKPSGGDFILAKFSNVTTNKRARILVKVDGGSLITETLDPGAVLNTRYNGYYIDMQIIYEDYTIPAESFKPIDFIKGKVRQQIINKDGKIRISTMDAVGTRG